VRVAVSTADEREVHPMSLASVEVVITRLLTDEELRLRFVVDRVETLGELHERGCTLTPSEIDLFIECDPELWFWFEHRVVGRMH
jgi:hypothetical protein